MMVKELINILSKLNQDYMIKVWDAFNDCETDNVIISEVIKDKEVFISDTDFSCLNERNS